MRVYVCLHARARTRAGVYDMYYDAQEMSSVALHTAFRHMSGTQTTDHVALVQEPHGFLPYYLTSGAFPITSS